MVENKIKLEIVTPYGVVLSEEVDEIIAHGSEGEFGVLPGHIPFLTTLRIGMLTYKKSNITAYCFVNQGYIEVKSDRVLILAESAEKSEDIDIERALAAKKRAEERLKQAEKFDHARATASLQRAVTRLQVAERKSAK